MKFDWWKIFVPSRWFTLQKSRPLNSIAKIILNYNDWVLNDISRYECELENSNYKIIFWNANRPYAWFSDGVFINKNNNTYYKWKNCMLSIITQLKVEKKIEYIKESVMYNVSYEVIESFYEGK